ncbi:type I-F CRISPR-associated helicase Cas3f [Zooshikella sp. RANM57]|uniref:type I-F CRISPR-associated helicase Cas3f n=1 Tax=Zooshikella sp. RANM57 TaxID=3425863 RepID=UPI003D6FA242
MNILLVSQCQKKALKETRRILDQFAERVGDFTWQTAITKQGLDTLRQILRKKARKNTAVACHWIRGKDNSELLWIVGDASRFDTLGRVPTNTTQRNILRADDENDWHTIEDIRLISAMASLFHDFGKANKRFQSKLRENFNKKTSADPIRHEWISLRLFNTFIGDKCRDDQEWLQRLADNPTFPDDWQDKLTKDKLEMSAKDTAVISEGISPFKKLPPLAKVIGWLIVSHHRLPFDQNKKVACKATNAQALNKLPERVKISWCGARENATKQHIKQCWTFEYGLPSQSKAWQKRVQKLAVKMLNRRQLFTEKWFVNPYVIHVSRLALMLADHYYSSLSDPSQRVRGDKDCRLYANTTSKKQEDGADKTLNQPLDEHLIGVEKQNHAICYHLPYLKRQLPSITRHKGFQSRSRNQRFNWQNKAYDLAKSIQQKTQDQGFFGINMASTGCGKTLANGRIMYALANEQQGARFTIALGLRILTLQTGEVYRSQLQLGADELAVMVGGSAVREIHKFQQRMSQQDFTEQAGSESVANLLEEQTRVFYESSLQSGPISHQLAKNAHANRLLQSPILTCTIDHLMPATESLRGGHQIVPSLRLMTSDLILDEPDDFDQQDLYALSRLVYWSGMLGSRVLLSSATLPPAIIHGLFDAYYEGRKIFQKNRGAVQGKNAISCAWFDEFNCIAGDFADTDGFTNAHTQFVDKRLIKLGQMNTIVRRAEIKPLVEDVAAPDLDNLPVGDQNNTPEGLLFQSVAWQLQQYSVELHYQHNTYDELSGKHVSFGLVRMANIYPLVNVTKTFLALQGPTDTVFHCCCYHSNHLLTVRSAIEQRLDRCLNRKGDKNAVFSLPEIQQSLARTSAKHHIFIVFATPVAEVGRDHDYDWGIVEPSSMRSIIQLAGRIQRHRMQSCASPNLFLLSSNIKHLQSKNNSPCFCTPGFENETFKLNSHDLFNLLESEQYKTINAAPRIRENIHLRPADNLVDLEHAHLKAIMLEAENGRVASINLWWQTQANLSAELQQAYPFRQSRPTMCYAMLLDEDDEPYFCGEGTNGKWGKPQNALLNKINIDRQNAGKLLWGEYDYLVLLEQWADNLGYTIEDCAKRFSYVELPRDEAEQGWNYHDALGFWRMKRN